jgi:N-acetylneuraminic acid mutarotase
MNTKDTKIQIMSLMTLTVILGVLPSMSLAGAQWTYLTDIPTTRAALSASVVDGKIYAIGGKIMPFRQTTSSSAVEEYDPMTNQWSQKADMPITRANFSTSVVDSKIYAIGGYTGQNGNTPPRSSVDVYDPATNNWSQIASMPIGEADHSSAVVDGKIYVIGGNTVQIYDPLTDTWTRGADRPSTPRWWAPVSVVDGKIYSIGGAKGPPTWQVVPTVEEYDPATDTWTAKTNIPIATASHASVVVDGRIYVINGNGVTGTVLSLVQIYDPATGTWMEAPHTSIARQLPSAGVVDGTIYLMGGFNPNVDRLVSFGAVEALDLNPAVDFNADTFVDIDDLLRLIESWGLDDPLVDIGPMPWGDGIVDARDVLVLAKHMVEYANDVSDIQ